jgi:hypothetical protein
VRPAGSPAASRAAGAGDRVRPCDFDVAVPHAQG